MKIGYDLVGAADASAIDIIRSLCEDFEKDRHIIFKYHKNRRDRIISAPYSPAMLEDTAQNPNWITSQIALPFLIAEAELDIYFSPFFKLPLRQPCKTVVKLEEVGPLLFPDEKIRGLENRLKHMIYCTAAKKANRIIAPSYFAAKHISKALKADPARISVVYTPAPKCFTPVFNYSKIEKVREKYGIDHFYFIYSGDYFEKNNIKELVELFCSYLSLKNDAVLVMEGAVSEELKAEISKHAPANRLIFTGSLPDEELALLFNGSSAFITASLFESCCSKALAACACGIPVIAYNNSSFPEILKNAAILVNGGDKRFFVRAMRDAKENQNLRLKLRALGIQHAKHFTPDKSAKALREVMEEVRLEAYTPDAK